MDAHGESIVIERTIGTVLAGAADRAQSPKDTFMTPLDRTELPHVADADPAAFDRVNPKSSALDQAELYRQAVVGRDAAACIEWLRRFANWDPGEE